MQLETNVARAADAEKRAEISGGFFFSFLFFLTSPTRQARAPTDSARRVRAKRSEPHPSAERKNKIKKKRLVLCVLKP